MEGLHLPNEVLAMGTECWLLEEPWNETMVLDIVDILLFERSFTDTVPHRSSGLLHSSIIVIIVCHLVNILSIHLNFASINANIAKAAIQLFN